MTANYLLIRQLYRNYLGCVIHDKKGRPYVVAHIQIGFGEDQLCIEFYERSKHYGYLVPTITTTPFGTDLPPIFPDPEYHI